MVIRRHPGPPNRCAGRCIKIRGPHDCAREARKKSTGRETCYQSRSIQRQKAALQRKTNYSSIQLSTVFNAIQRAKAGENTGKASTSGKLTDTNKIHLSDLKLETHHWGGYLVGKAIVDPFVYGCVISVIEDERGNCGTLTVFNQDDNLLDTLIPCDAIVAVKEPYCKFNNDNDFVIRVDHPSDIHIWRAGDDRIPGGLDAFQDKKSLTAQEWKASGDKAFLGKKYLESISWYVYFMSWRF